MYLVTGGAGFIGSHLCDALLARGERVRVLDDLSTGKRENVPNGAELLVGNVADPVAVRDAAAGIQGCFHLAAIASVARGMEDWRGTHRANLTATITLLDALRGRNVPVVYASSAAVYGDCKLRPIRRTRRFGHYRLMGPTSWDASWMRGSRLMCTGTDCRAALLQRVRAAAGSALALFGCDFDLLRASARRPVGPDPRGWRPDARFRLCGGRRDGAAGGHGWASQRGASAKRVHGAWTSVLRLAEAIGAVLGHEPVVEHGPSRPGDIRDLVGIYEAAASARRGAVHCVHDGLAQTLRWMNRS